MLTGQEKISELIKIFPKAKKILAAYGLTLEAEAHFKYKSLAHAALTQKISLKKLLNELAEVTGQKVRAVKVKGLNAGVKPGFRHGTPSGIGKTIVVHSGKGGVGKTFVSVNLATYLAMEGYKVGLLDGDVDCPNVMEVLKINGKLIASENKKILPLEKFNLKVVSMAPLLAQSDQPLMWRGPIISRVIEQFVHDTEWGDLDFLVVDLPSGTGDAPLTLLNILDQPNFVAITTSQDLALLDCKKSIKMAQKLNLRVLGVVENMSGAIFGKGGGQKISEDLGVPLLGAIEMKAEYARLETTGKPAVLRSNELKSVFAKMVKTMKL